MSRLFLPTLPCTAVLAVGLLVACQKSVREPAEPAETAAVQPSATKASAVSDVLFLGLIFPYAPPKPSGPVTQAALLLTRQGAPIEQVTLGTFDGRATVLDSLMERGFPDSTLLGFRALYLTTGTDVAVLRANDTMLHVLSRPIRDTISAADFTLLKKVPIAAHSHVRVVR
ncbi:hypothetical protein H8B13_04875 [Hymenobacter sp. BT188]|uniref:hypothetical protein n=1 Tax=Hymenobacter sp. BT188 TaxID=2763504 RepID=UPI00165185FF|nr:hypothetical protein [Hymenobacter sp. BT188]MBC6606145.1 hypothetical protein [Hymenobacter sp. BT188]